MDNCCLKYSAPADADSDENGDGNDQPIKEDDDIQSDRHAKVPSAATATALSAKCPGCQFRYCNPCIQIQAPLLSLLGTPPRLKNDIPADYWNAPLAERNSASVAQIENHGKFNRWRLALMHQRIRGYKLFRVNNVAVTSQASATPSTRITAQLFWSLLPGNNKDFTLLQGEQREHEDLYFQLRALPFAPYFVIVNGAPKSDYTGDIDAVLQSLDDNLQSNVRKIIGISVGVFVAMVFISCVLTYFSVSVPLAKITSIMVY
ncbi:hypothetical protein CcCBS67573_g09093 [Chytriomyces confervae]|uniref:Uncharacterized protein n=1 Tax=Chytriomyces confervae TaxID=246404 RepID=A0A507E5N9_9FUNG|nr:hypothetical protein CcCBS67573_g09093 [Chytriomyces confervae]